MILIFNPTNLEEKGCKRLSWNLVLRIYIQLPLLEWKKADQNLYYRYCMYKNRDKRRCNMLQKYLASCNVYWHFWAWVYFCLLCVFFSLCYAFIVSLSFPVNWRFSLAPELAVKLIFALPSIHTHNSISTTSFNVEIFSFRFPSKKVVCLLWCTLNWMVFTGIFIILL